MLGQRRRRELLRRPEERDVPPAIFPDRARARFAVVGYIEVFYNRQRLHSTLGYRTRSKCLPSSRPQQPLHDQQPQELSKSLTQLNPDGANIRDEFWGQRCDKTHSAPEHDLRLGWQYPSLQDRTPTPHPASPIQGAAGTAGQLCSLHTTLMPVRHDTPGPYMRLSANLLCSPRRSDDGQAILKRSI